MKQGFYAVIYVTVFFVCFIGLTIEQYKYDRMTQEKIRQESNLKKSVRDAAEEFSTAIYDTEERKRQKLSDAFFESLYVYFGTSATEEKLSLMLHVPMIVLIEEDGTSFLSLEECKSEEGVELRHIWSKKKKMTLSEVEERAGEIISGHSYIAKQYGLEYSFFVPDFLLRYEKPDLPVFLVVFQGWPLSTSGNMVYNNCIDAGVSIKRTEYYIVEVPESINCTYSFYHRFGCDRIGGSGRVLEGRFTLEEARDRYGALPCEECVKCYDGMWE